MILDKKEASQIPIETLFKKLNSSPSGISNRQSLKLLKKYGKNSLSHKNEFNFLIQFFQHFLNPLSLILLFASILSFFMNQKKDAILIFCILFFGVSLDFIQEYSANKAMKKLLNSVKTTINVIRNGKKQEIPITHLVVGDIILLSSGDMVPADARIIESKDFFVNQSAITGESFPSEKTPIFKESKKSSIAEIPNLIFNGTSVLSGSATAIVLGTGANTEFGKIIFFQENPKSYFEKGITNFGILLMKIILILVIFIFFINAIFKQDFFQSFMFAIAIGVGLTPELLPMIMSITMTVGSKKMAKKGVIVKKLSAIPNFGSMNILCTDKTGTLTENKISLVKYSDYKGSLNEDVFLFAYLNSSFQTGLKNPLDDAIISYKKLDIKNFKKIDEVPYDFFRKKMSIVIKKNNDVLLVSKGAPEEIIKSCKYIKKSGKKVLFNNSLKSVTIKTYNELSSQGYRVLGVSSKSVHLKEVYSKKDEFDMVFEGFVSFFDPPKKDVQKAIKELKVLGVETKIITGDNEIVTKKICSEIGIKVEGVLLGEEIQKMNINELKIKAQKTTIFARCSPEEKLKIIHALKSGENIVGYLGDGINDSPSLRVADVGISVDSATDIAKESSEIILTRKSLSDLKEGVVDGRKTFGNTMKYIMMSLSSNFGNMFSAAGASFFLPFLPMLPIQILLNNMIYDLSEVTIPSDNVDKDWIDKPKKWDLKFIKKFMYIFGPISSLFDFITFFVLFFVIKASAPVFQTGWFLESLATQTLVIHLIRTKKSFFKSRASYFLIGSSIFCLALGWILPYTSLGRLFKFEPLPPVILLVIGAIVLLYLLTVEIVKKIFYKKFNF